MPITTPQVQPIQTQGNKAQSNGQSAGHSTGQNPILPHGITAEVWAAMDDATKAAVSALARKAQAHGQAGRLTLKVSVKGALSVYGLGRFPVTLYASQWARLLSAVDELKAYIAANAEALAEKQ